MRNPLRGPGSIGIRPSAAMLWLLLALAGCGFQLRGSANLPFDSIYIDMPNSNMGAELKRNLRTGTNVKVVENRDEAQAILTRAYEARTKLILSINSAGRVREFRLRYVFNYSLIDKQGRDLAAPATLSIERDFSFNDNQVLAKESEESLLYRDMQLDLEQQVLRRLAATPAKPLAPADPDK